MNNQEITQADKSSCPRCQLSHIKRNGHTYYGKQNYQCLLCDRQFVIRQETVSFEKQELIKSLLLERISLRGICRVLKISLSWLLNFIEELYQSTPEDLNARRAGGSRDRDFLLRSRELRSFVEKRTNKRWVWLVMERRTRQIIALHIGDRSQHSAVRLWAKVPPVIKANALVLTDCWDAYAVAIPANRHRCLSKAKRTSFIDRTL